MNIALYHSYYNNKHLSDVQTEMTKRGAPVIRAIWSECYGMWLAIEGCHRLRAAQNLGLMPIIKDVSSQKTVTYQMDGRSVRVQMADLIEELQDNAPRTTILTFED